MKKCVFIFPLIVCACAGSQTWIKNMDSFGGLSIEPTEKYYSDYLVEFKGNTMDIGYNSNNREDRIKILNTYVSSTCPNGYIIQKEDSLKMGKKTENNSIENYFVYLKCK